MSPGSKHAGSCPFLWGLAADLPAFCTSMGRVLLAYLPGQELGEVFAERPTPDRSLKRRSVHPETLRRELHTVFKQGYAMVDQELEIGLRSLAVPVLAREDRAVAAINIGAHAARTNKNRTATSIPSGLAEGCEEYLFLPWVPLSSDNAGWRRTSGMTRARFPDRRWSKPFRS